MAERSIADAAGLMAQIPTRRRAGRGAAAPGAGLAPGRPDTPDLHVTALRRLPPAPAQYAPFPEQLDARLRDALASRGISQLYTHQAQSVDHALAAPQRGGHHADRIGQDALLQRCRCCTRSCRTPSSRALYLFPTKALAQDQLAELQTMCETLAGRPPGSGQNDSSEQIGVFTYDGDTPQDARRAIRGRAHLVLSNPDMLHSGILPHHPRWAKLFENLRYRGHRRAARVSRRVRQPSVQRAAAAAPGLPTLRIGSGLHLFVGDDCQSAGAGRAPRRTAVRAGRRKRRAARREVLRLRQPADRQPSAGHPALVSRRDQAHRRGVPQAQPPAHRVCPEPSRHRDSDHLPEGRFRGRARGAGAHSRLSRRVSAEPPPRDREGAARGRGAGRRVHQCAGARHRHRRARCQRDGGLSRARSPPRGSARDARGGAPAGPRR